MIRGGAHTDHAGLRGQHEPLIRLNLHRDSCSCPRRVSVTRVGFTPFPARAVVNSLTSRAAQSLTRQGGNNLAIRRTPSSTFDRHSCFVRCNDQRAGPHYRTGHNLTRTNSCGTESSNSHAAQSDKSPSRTPGNPFTNSGTRQRYQIYGLYRSFRSVP